MSERQLRIALAAALAAWMAGLSISADAAEQLFDLDGNGAPDTALVGDWNDDGRLETSDVQEAVNALTDAGAKRVYVLPGVYLPPDEIPSGRGLITLPSDTVLECVGDAVVLRGVPPPPSGPDVSIATVTNADHVRGNSNIVIANCEITGGMPDSYDTTGWNELTRMGVWFQSVTLGIVQNSFVHHTLHSCLYAKNSRAIVFNGNLLEDCGGYGDVSDRVHQPGIYLYAVSDSFAPAGGLTDGVWVSNNVVRRTANAALNLRRASTTDLLRNITFEGNVVEDTRANTAKCMMLRGAEQVVVRNQTCLRTGPLSVGGKASGFFSTPSQHVDSLRGLTLDGVDLAETGYGAGLELGRYLEDVTLRNVRVRRTRDGNPCVALDAPARNARIEGLSVSECSGEGFLQRGCGPVCTEEAGLALKDVRVDGAGVTSPLQGVQFAGIRFGGRAPGLTIEDVEISRISGSGIDLGPNALTGARLRNISVDGVPSGFLGRMPAASLPACTSAMAERWAIVSDAAHSSTCVGGGGSTVTCRCHEGLWKTAHPGAPRYGIHLRNGTSADVLLDSIRVSNVAGSYGIRVEGAPVRISIVRPIGVDDSEATLSDQLGAVDMSADAQQISVTGATCLGTSPETPCVRTDVSHPDRVDLDRNGIADSCESRCGLGFELALIVPLVSRLARMRWQQAVLREDR